MRLRATSTMRGRESIDDSGRIAKKVISLFEANPLTCESADGMARRAGLRSRHQLNRVLRENGLPSFRNLAALFRVIGLHDNAVAAGRSLCAECIAERIDPAWAYRTVKRVIGKTWREVSELNHHDLLRLMPGVELVETRTCAEPQSSFQRSLSKHS